MEKLLTKNQIYKLFKEKYSQYAPAAELMIKAEQVEKLNKLVRAKSAVILKHNYMTWDLQCDEVLGIRGDSLELSRRAGETKADIILFLGVKFMAETAKVLNPSKKVLIPSLRAGCSLAASINGADVRALKKMFPGVPVVAYVNTDADTKAEVDVCCASGNARKVVEWAMKEWKTNKVIFIPDKFLCQNIGREMGVDVYFPDMNAPVAKLPKNKTVLIGWPGKCEVHERFRPEDVDNLRKDFPGVYIMAHPECPPEVVKKVDFAGSTGEMIRNVTSDAVADKQVAFFTECAMVEMLAAAHKNVLQVCSIMKRCPHMATNSLENAIEALQNEQYEINVPEEMRAKAEIPIRRMISIK